MRDDVVSLNQALEDCLRAPACGRMCIGPMMLDWFDYWLKDAPTRVLSRAPVRLFVMGANTWRDEQEWPLARAAATPFYFHSGGKANTLNGDGTLSQTAPSDERSDRFVYDPWNLYRQGSAAAIRGCRPTSNNWSVAPTCSSTRPRRSPRRWR